MNGRGWVALVALALAVVACSRDEHGGEPVLDGGAADATSTPGFPVIPTAPGRHELTFTHDGQTRMFILYLPASYDHRDARPLFVALHGGGGSAKALFREHPFERYADETGIIFVAAQGTTKDEAAGYEWNGYQAFDSGADDVGYLEQVVVGLSAALKIDARRRWLAGFSGGATMTVRFGTERSELLAAIGTFAGKVGRAEGASPPLIYPPEPTTPLSVQMTYGTDDDNYTGGLKDGSLFSSAREGMSWWAAALGCGSTPGSQVTGQLTFDTYPGCDSGSVVRMITVDGMGHMWPDKEDGLDGTRLLLDFFADKVKP